MKKNKNIKKIILLIISIFLLTGCTTYLKDDNNKNVSNEKTGQSLASNILCKPENKESLEIYEKYEKKLAFKLDELPKCENLKLYNSKTYTGLWAQIFVIPLAWFIIKIGVLVKNYGLSIMLVGLLIRIILTPLTIKSAKQSENMSKAQPELAKLEKKYESKTDSDSMMKKSQETMAIYKKYKIKPINSCLTAFIQLPLFLAFLEAINRVPVIFEEKLWKFQLGTTPLVGIKDGNYFYIILIIFIILTTFFSFKTNKSMSSSPEQEKQMKYTTNIMLVFISIASFSLPTAIGLYWSVTNGYAVVQNLFLKQRRA